VYDALTLGGTRGGDAEAGSRQRTEDRRAFPTEGGMRSDAGGFVDDHDLIVVVDDAEVRDGHRDDLRFAPLLPLHLEPARCAQAVGFAQRAAVHPHPASLGDLSGEGAGEPQHLGQRGIHTGAVEAVGHGQDARRHQASRGAVVVSSAPVAVGSVAADWSAARRSRVPSRRTPISTNSATPIIIVTMNMSATL